MNNEGFKTTARLLCACLLSVSFCSQTALALNPRKSILQYSLDVWKQKDGLPQVSVRTIVQTRDGYLWLGTEGGLVRFDGVRFTSFDKRNTSEIRDNEIRSLLEDRQGQSELDASRSAAQ